MESPIKTTLYLPEELHASLKMEAARRRIPMTQLVIQAIERELRIPAHAQRDEKG